MAVRSAGLACLRRLGLPSASQSMPFPRRLSGLSHRSSSSCWWDSSDCHARLGAQWGGGQVPFRLLAGGRGRDHDDEDLEGLEKHEDDDPEEGDEEEKVPLDYDAMTPAEMLDLLISPVSKSRRSRQRQQRKSFYELVYVLPHFGAGVKVMRKEWIIEGFQDTYVTIEKVKFRFHEDGRLEEGMGATGWLTWRGVQVDAYGQPRTLTRLTGPGLWHLWTPNIVENYREVRRRAAKVPEDFPYYYLPEARPYLHMDAPSPEEDEEQPGRTEA